MTTRLPKSRAKRPAAPKPKSGAADAGAAFDPTRLADDDPSGGPAKAAVRAAPAPGVPVSDARYETLKRKAETARKPPSKHSQEDPAAKK